jgi:hypothetical protein
VEPALAALCLGRALSCRKNRRFQRRTALFGYDYRFFLILLMFFTQTSPQADNGNQAASNGKVIPNIHYFTS